MGLSSAEPGTTEPLKSDMSQHVSEVQVCATATHKTKTVPPRALFSSLS